MQLIKCVYIRLRVFVPALYMYVQVYLSGIYSRDRKRESERVVTREPDNLKSNLS